MIISPVCSFEDVSYGIYDTVGLIAIASEYGCDVYANMLEKLSSKTTSYEDTIFFCGVPKQDTLFDAVEFQRRCQENPFAIDHACLTTFS